MTTKSQNRKFTCTVEIMEHFFPKYTKKKKSFGSDSYTQEEQEITSKLKEKLQKKLGVNSSCTI